MCSIRKISCESPEKYIWDEFLYLENESVAKRFLTQKYSALGASHAERVSFRNVYDFISYIKQARNSFLSIKKNSLWIQPLLLYYGMMGLLKALLLTIDTDYPQNTTVLRHGLSTRKRKKVPFRFSQDEIRVQKEGLFPHLAKLLGVSIATGETFITRNLLGMIPDLQSTYQRVFNHPSLIPIELSHDHPIPEATHMEWEIEDSVLDQLHLTPQSLVEKLNSHSISSQFRLSLSQDQKNRVQMIWLNSEVPHVNSWSKGFNHPWFMSDKKGNYYLWLSNNCPIHPIPEYLTLYMLLFSLSMLCRYDPPLWGEIIDSDMSEERILIEQLLSTVTRKFPQMILELFYEEKWILRIQ
ncbi:YaaC-like protein [Hazenella coriacea]|uniref:YaaC-like protein n=2 Tax=Hazenella coriacea TaxID=1179467 RepID=A0A4R3L6T9_9BACL|nr:YaaC-like protein [Hazenella coriacea]